MTSLGEYLPTQPTEGLDTWRGELRSGARANVLMGVASNRVDVHQRLRRGRARLGTARPSRSRALLLPHDRYPEPLLRIGWRNLVLNSAHDSSCACSADEVVDAVVVRYQEARHIGDALAARCACRARRRDRRARRAPPSSSTRPGSTAAASCTGSCRAKGRCTSSATTARAARRRSSGTIGGEGFTAIVIGQKVRWVLEMIRGPEFAGTRIARVESRSVGPADWEYTFFAARPGEPMLDLEETREELLALGEEDATIRFRQVLAPTREVVFRAETVPGFGWRTYTAAAGEGPPSALEAGDGTLANEHLAVARRPEDRHVHPPHGRRHRARRGSTGSSTAATAATPTTTRRRPTTWWWTYPSSCASTTVESGPVRARLLVERDVRAGRRSRSATSGVCTPAQRGARARRGVDRCSSSEPASGSSGCTSSSTTGPAITGSGRTSRCPCAVRGSDAECAFAVVHRGLEAEGGPHEFPLPTFVSRRFVDCAAGDVGLAVLHDGLLEYEVVHEGRELALTLLRATGYLSRSELALRPNPAGPLDPLEGPQLQGRLAVDYALLPHRGDWRDAGVHDAADDFLVPLERVRGGGVAGAARPPSGRALRVEGAEVSAVAPRLGLARGPRLQRVAGSERRDHRPRREPGARAGVVDLLGRPLEPFEYAVPLRAWEIVTIRIAEPHTAGAATGA